MALTLVNSSSIRVVGYDGSHLFVQFHANGTTYTHYGVPYSVYAAFMDASSMGAYYNRHLRGRHH